MSRSLVRGTSIVSILTIVSRILGLLRDMVVAPVLGTGLLSDAFVVAFRIPNLLRSLVAEGALTSAFVPVFAERERQGRDCSVHTLRSVSGMLLLLTSLLTGLGFIFAPEIVQIIGAGFTADPGQFELCVSLTRIMFPFILFVSLVAAVNGALNTVHRYGAAPLAQIVMNGVLILGALIASVFSPERAVYILAVTVIVGGVFQVLVQIPALRREGFSLLPQRPIFNSDTWQILRLMVPAVFGSAIYQITVVLSTTFASVLVAGSVTWLFFADRVAQLPMGVFTVALASVLLPELSRSAADNDMKRFNKSLSDVLRYTTFTIIPLVVGIFLFAEPICEVFFGRGRFTLEAITQTARAVAALSLGLWSMSCHSMVVRAFLALKDTRTPTLISFASLMVNVVAALLLMGPPVRETEHVIAQTVVALQEFLFQVFPHLELGHVGLALSSVFSSSVSFFGAVVLINKKKRVSLPLSDFLKATAQALFGAMVMGVAFFLLEGGFQLSPYLLIGMGIPLCIVSFLLGVWGVKSRELFEVVHVIRRKFSSQSGKSS